jgi:hypothetical protein
VLQLGSEELNKVSPRSISPTTIKIQSHISDGDFHTAFRAAHAEINRCIERDAKPNLWDVQLMRVAAMQIGNERIYVDTLNVLEQRGVLDADEPEYLPVGYTITERMRQEMKDEATAEGEDPARSQLFAKLETHDISPIDKTAVRVGAKKVPGA